MKRYLLIGIFLCSYTFYNFERLSASNLSMNKTQNQIKESKKISFGFEQEDKKILLKIPTSSLGRRVEISALIEKGFDMLARPLNGLGIMTIALKDSSTLLFNREIHDERILSKNSPFSEVFDRSIKQNQNLEFPIVKQNTDYFFIDITSQLKEEGAWYQCDYDNFKAAKASFTQVIDIKKFDQGISFYIKKMHGHFISNANYVGAPIYSRGLMPLYMSCSVRLLDSNKMPIRHARNDQFQTISYFDYSLNPYKAVKDSILCKWNLTPSSKESKKYNSGSLVEPTKPIVFHINRYFPKEYIHSIQNAVKSWNQVLSEAGFKNAIQISINKDDWNAPAAATIAYDLVHKGFETQIIYDNETGEITSCHINVGHNFMVDLLEEYFFKKGKYDARILKNPKSQDVACELFEEKIHQAIGKCLGLKNGETDEENILWAYKAFPSSENPYQDYEQLKVILNKRKSNQNITNLDTTQLQSISYVYSNLDAYIQDQTLWSNLSTKAAKWYIESMFPIIDQINGNNSFQKAAFAFEILQRYLIQAPVYLHNDVVNTVGIYDAIFYLKKDYNKLFMRLLSPQQIIPLIQNSNNNSYTLESFENQLTQYFIEGVTVPDCNNTNYLNIQLSFYQTILSISQNKNENREYNLFINKILKELSNKLASSKTDDHDSKQKAVYEYMLQLK